MSEVVLALKSCPSFRDKKFRLIKSKLAHMAKPKSDTGCFRIKGTGVQTGSVAY